MLSCARENGMDETLEEMMVRARAGDNKAYAAFLRRIVPMLENFIGARLGDRGECDDIVQETLISIHRAGHTWQEGRPLKPWIYAIADKRFKDYLRKYYRRRAEQTYEHDVIDRKAAQDSVNPVTSGNALSEYAGEALESLPEKQRTAVTMMKLEGYSARDVGQRLDMSEGAVKVMVHRAYKELARTMRLRREQAAREYEAE
jgi:RNA polymerase sigma-70 factor (ECF subfamily)